MILKIILGIYLLTVITCMICVFIQVHRFNTCIKMLENRQSSKRKLQVIISSIFIIIIKSIVPFYNIYIIIDSFTMSKEEIMELANESKIDEISKLYLTKY